MLRSDRLRETLALPSFRYPFARDTNEPAATAQWREQAVARSLDSARTRAENRVQRFLDAALELMTDSDTGKEFTVQEVVERSGQSLRSFYQYFGGKHELLLALFEESVRSTAEELAGEGRGGGRAARAPALLRRRVLPDVPPARRARPSRSCRSRRSMVDFAQQLLTAHPAEAARAYAPVVVAVQRGARRGCRGRGHPRRPPPRPDRGHRARGDHVQRLLGHDRRHARPRRRRRPRRGALGPGVQRHRGGARHVAWSTINSVRRTCASSGTARSPGAPSTGPTPATRSRRRCTSASSGPSRLVNARRRPRRADPHRHRRRVRTRRRPRRTHRAGGGADPRRRRHRHPAVPRDPGQPGAGDRGGQRDLPGRRAAHRDDVGHRGRERPRDVPGARAAAGHPRRAVRRRAAGPRRAWRWPAICCCRPAGSTRPRRSASGSISRVVPTRSCAAAALEAAHEVLQTAPRGPRCTSSACSTSATGTID